MISHCVICDFCKERVYFEPTSDGKHATLKKPDGQTTFITHAHPRDFNRKSMKRDSLLVEYELCFGTDEERKLSKVLEGSTFCFKVLT